MYVDMLKRLLTNDIIEYSNDSSQVRVLYMDTSIDLCITIALKTKKLNILNESLKAMEELLENQSARLVTTDSTCSFIDVNQLTLAQKKILDARWEVVQYLHSKDVEPDVFFKKNRALIVKETCYRFNKHKKVVYEYLRLYLQGGKRKLALIPKYDKCGARGKTKYSITKKLGRPNTYIMLKNSCGVDCPDEMKGINIDMKARNNIFSSIRRYCFGNSGISLSKAKELMKRDHYSVADDLGNKTPIPAQMIPTDRQFYYWNNKLKEMDFVDYQVKTKGQKHFDLNSRAITSNTKYDTFGPGYRYEIDATKPNIRLLNRLRTDAIGTPVVYYVVDTFSTKLVGLYVGLEGPSWNGATSALYNVIEDKVSFAKKYGLDINERDWSNSTLPKILLADRGEFVGTLPENAIENLEMTLENTPSGRGDLKGNIEKSFNITEQMMIGMIPGYSTNKYRERNETDPNSKAKFTLDEITKVFIRLAINYNHREIKDYPFTEEMINDGVRPIPEEIWAWGCENISGNLTSWDENFVKFNLMRRDIATVTERGIEFEGVIYHSEKSLVQAWSSKARISGNWKLEMAFDQRNMNHIYLVDKINNQFEICQLAKECSAFLNKSYNEIKLYRIGKVVNHLNMRDGQNKNNMDLYVGMSEDAKGVKQNYTEANGKRKPSATQIRENRAEDNKLIRDEQALVIGDSTTLEESIPKANNCTVSKNQSMFDRIRKAKGVC
jgi:hypothetical protein